MTGTKNRELQEGLGFPPIDCKINEVKLRLYFNKLCGKMSLKLYCLNGTQGFSETPVFSTVFSTICNSVKVINLCLKLHLSQAEHELLKVTQNNLRYSTLSKKEEVYKICSKMRGLLQSNNLIRVYVLLYGTKMTVFEAEKQLSHSNIYQYVSNGENILLNSSVVSNKSFSSFREKGFITGKKLKKTMYGLNLRQLIKENFTFF